MRGDKNHKVGVAGKITYKLCEIWPPLWDSSLSQKVEWQVDGPKMAIRGIAVIFGQRVRDAGKMC